MRPVFTVVGVACCLVLGAVQVSGSSLINCSSSFKRYTFTPCDPATKKMLSVEYFNQSCLETDQVELRSPLPVDCVKMCGSGTYYAPTPWGAECSWCPRGSSSNSGGRIINNFDDIPDDFVTYCSPQPCNAWTPDPLGGMLTSGNQTGLRVATDPRWPPDEAVRVELVTIIDVINLEHGGKFTCDYRVESEPFYDGLQVLVNGSIYVLPTVSANASSFEKRFVLTGVHYGWRRLVIKLPYGSTEVRLVYVKDRDQSSVLDPEMYGADRAYVRDIVIEGVQLFAPTCTPCAAGTYASSPGRQTCEPCPANTFSGDGAYTCTRCPDGQWSPPGSEVCIPKPDCQPEDYVAIYSACNPATLTRSFQWQLPSTAQCIPRAAAPRSDMQPCSVCMPGMKYNTVSLKCEPCLPGQYRNADGACVNCGRGTASVPTVEFDGFDRFGDRIDPSFFEQQCTGRCAACPAGNLTCTVAGGFTLASVNAVGDSDGDNTIVAIRSDSNNGASYTSRLRYRFTSASPGWFEIKYYFQHSASGRVLQANTVEAEVRLDHGTVVTLRSTATLHNLGTIRLNVATVGDHVIDIMVSQNARTAPVDETLLVLTYLRVHGDTRGAVTVCSLCMPGYYCPERASGYLPCAPGSYSATGGSDHCEQCPAHEIAEYPASTYCSQCPPGTTNHVSGITCVPSCDKVVVGEAHFNLSKLENVYFGPLFLPGADATMPSSAADVAEVARFYMSFCKNVNNNGTSHVCESRLNQTIKPSYACQRLSGSRAYSLGEDPAFALDRHGQLTYGVTGGDNCVRGGMARSTNVTMVCDVTAKPPGLLQFAFEEPHCHYAFTFRSPYACQTCTEEDYEIYESPCDPNGVYTVTYVRKPNSRACVGGYEIPPPTTLTCKRCMPVFYEPSWSKCTNGYRLRMFTVKPEYSGCSDDGTAVRILEAEYKAQKLSLNETCRSIDATVGANAFTAVSGGVVLVILILVVIVFIIAHQYSRLHHEYGTLAQANASNNGWEMNEVSRRNEATRNNNDDGDDEEEDRGTNEPAVEATSSAKPSAPKLQDS